MKKPIEFEIQQLEVYENILSEKRKGGMMELEYNLKNNRNMKIHTTITLNIRYEHKSK